MKLLSFLNHRKPIFILFTVLVVVSALLIPLVEVNYDLTEYLPDDMATKQSLEIMQEEFGDTGMAEVMVSNVDIPQALAYKEQIAAVPGVKSVLFLDDVVDIRQPLEALDSSTVESYYKDQNALFQVEFTYNDYAPETGEALKQIHEIIGEENAIRGTAYNAQFTQQTASGEATSIMLIVVPIVLLILVAFTSSWFECLLYLFILGVSIVINMGTNVFLPSVSFITFSMAAVLQMAISVDYSLFLVHRFNEERLKEPDPTKAMKTALRATFSSLSASCLTTVAGFVALMFMRYSLGFDMGIVLAKGIVISLLCVLFLLPVVILKSLKLIDRTQHRTLIPSFKKISQGIYKSRIVAIVLVVLLCVPFFLAQNNNTFQYGESAASSDTSTQVGQESQQIQDVFGAYNPAVILLPSGDIARESQLSQELLDKPYITSVQGLATLADPAIPDSMYPAGVAERFQTENYSRIILTMNTPIESQETFQAVDDLKATIGQYYDQYYVTGSSVSIGDIKAVVDGDYLNVTLISILAIAIIILFTFRSLSLPVLLVLVIEMSIWINMGVPYFQGVSLSFIGYLIISSIQLGATIDYAILMTNRYLEGRRMYPKREAMQFAVQRAGGAILTSGAVLCSAGFLEGLVSKVPDIQELGILLGRGAALSCLLVLIVLPGILVLCDTLICKTTLGTKDLVKHAKGGRKYEKEL